MSAGILLPMDIIIIVITIIIVCVRFTRWVTFTLKVNYVTLKKSTTE